MKDFWNDRYSSEEYAYGSEPNKFFRESMELYNLSGKILLPAEGEGRNAVFAAKNGLEVTAFDFSVKGKKKANKLAQENEVHINYLIFDFDEAEFEEEYFDSVAIFFAHLEVEEKKVHYSKLVKSLKPGGVIILEEFSKNQVKYQDDTSMSGGPKEENKLISEDEIKEIFPDLEILTLEEKIINLNEGEFHQGESSVVRFVGRKK